MIKEEAQSVLKVQRNLRLMKDILMHERGGQDEVYERNVKNME